MPRWWFCEFSILTHHICQVLPPSTHALDTMSETLELELPSNKLENYKPVFLTLSDKEEERWYDVIDEHFLSGTSKPTFDRARRNHPRNRFTNVLPRDQTLYELPHRRGDNHYVNASKVELMQSDGVTRTWIATQMPHQKHEETIKQELGESVGAFWAMVEALGRDAREKNQERGLTGDGDEVRIIMLTPPGLTSHMYFPAEDINGEMNRYKYFPEADKNLAMNSHQYPAAEDIDEDEQAHKLEKSFYSVSAVKAAFEFHPKRAMHVDDLNSDVRVLELCTYEDGPCKSEVPLESTTNVKHFLCGYWADFNIPKTGDESPLVKLLRLARQGSPGASDAKSTESDMQLSKPKLAPLVVHCMAGIGRTGTYIALDYLLSEMDRGVYDDCLRGEDGPWPLWFQDAHLGPKLAKKQYELGGDVVFDTVRKIRRQRVGSVQTAEQYIFIFSVLKQQWKERVKGLNDEYMRLHNALGSSDGESVVGGHAVDVKRRDSVLWRVCSYYSSPATSPARSCSPKPLYTTHHHFARTTNRDCENPTRLVQPRPTCLPAYILVACLCLSSAFNTSFVHSLTSTSTSTHARTRRIDPRCHPVMRFSTVIAAFSAGFAATTHAIATIETKGAKLFTSDGDQFFVKGIAYQLVPDDPLIDNTQCSLDAKLMKSIGTNSIRVYHVDPSAKHDDCMKAFEDAGIYIWLDLDTFDTQIEQTHPQWNQTQFDRFAKVMDAFHTYTNLAGFFVGNEVLTTGNGSVAAPYVKAAARDLKRYRDSKDYRKIPIGYSAADIATLRPMLQNYLACGDNASEALDFYSLNAYSWCGASSFQQSGYVDLIKNVTSVGYNIPIFLSETGCIEPSPRDFADQESIFGSDMTSVWSGAIIYEWIQEANNYGIVSYGDKVDPASPSAPPDGFPRSGTPIPRKPDFENLSNRWKTLSPTGVKASEYNPTLTPPPCPAFTSGAWEVDPKSNLPSLGQVFNAKTTDSPTPSQGSSEDSQGDASASGTSIPAEKGDAMSIPMRLPWSVMSAVFLGMFLGMILWV
ncbi:unnamed protein product [Periconia digitata]|uniref:1,3-beta-glucanosyltransferase n=1 Tax=Periconia digitata TaxID=1303443 RepID=A0A9W4XNV6_9PLEO|nr:unnamed protein product [Periconia digitata]